MIKIDFDFIDIFSKDVKEKDYDRLFPGLNPRICNWKEYRNNLRHEKIGHLRSEEEFIEKIRELITSSKNVSKLSLAFYLFNSLMVNFITELTLKCNAFECVEKKFKEEILYFTKLMAIQETCKELNEELYSELTQFTDIKWFCNSKLASTTAGFLNKYDCKINTKPLFCFLYSKITKEFYPVEPCTLMLDPLYYCTDNMESYVDIENACEMRLPIENPVEKNMPIKEKKSILNTIVLELF